VGISLKKASFFLLFIAILSCSVLSTFSGSIADLEADKFTAKQNHLPSGFDPHAPIHIRGNNELNQTAMSEGWSGNGSASNPFIIEGYSIQSQYTCVSIRDTDFHFIIQNCSLTTSAGNDYQAAVYLWDVSNGVVDSCFMFDKVVGIFLETSDQCKIINNTIYNVEFYTIEFWKCTGLTLANNTLIGEGFSIVGYNSNQWLHFFESNTVNGKPVLYLREQIGGILDCASYGQVILAACEDVDVRNAVIANATMGIALGACFNCRVYDNDVSWNKYGILVSVSSGIHIYNNTVHSYNSFGIHLNQSSGCIIEQNEVNTSKSVGIDQILSSDNTYRLNNITGSDWGGFVSHEGENITLTNNTIFENSIGITISYASNSRVLFNIIHNNTDTGLQIGWMSTSCKIYGNELGWNIGGNAYDEGSSNQWDDGISLGNFWSDYPGTGTYDIPGSAGSVDRFPHLIGEEYAPPATNTTTSTTSTTTSLTCGFITSPTTPGNGSPPEMPIQAIVLISAISGAGLTLVVVYIVLLRKS
jgi:parallel beta-helix repeat protein